MDLRQVEVTYNDTAIRAEWNDDGILVITIKDGCELNDFIPIAIAFWENFTEVLAKTTAIINNGMNEQSDEFFINIDSELCAPDIH